MSRLQSPRRLFQRQMNRNLNRALPWSSLLRAIPPAPRPSSADTSRARRVYELLLANRETTTTPTGTAPISGHSSSTPATLGDLKPMGGTITETGPTLRRTPSSPEKSMPNEDGQHGPSADTD